MKLQWFQLDIEIVFLDLETVLSNVTLYIYLKYVCGEQKYSPVLSPWMNLKQENRHHTE